VNQEPSGPRTADDRASGAAEALRGFPPVVYAPTAPAGDGGGGHHLEMLRLADGRTALLVYSAVDRLHAWWRADAPWVLLSVADLQRAHEAVPYDLLVLDRRPLLPGGAAGSAVPSAGT